MNKLQEWINCDNDQNIALKLITITIKAFAFTIHYFYDSHQNIALEKDELR